MNSSTSSGRNRIVHRWPLDLNRTLRRQRYESWLHETGTSTSKVTKAKHLKRDLLSTDGGMIYGLLQSIDNAATDRAGCAAPPYASPPLQLFWSDDDVRIHPREVCSLRQF